MANLTQSENRSRDLRRKLSILGNVLLEPTEPVDRLRAAVADLEEILIPLHGVPSANTDEKQRFRLGSPSGEVISPGYAVSTMQDAVRTAKFLRGLKAAVEAARERFAGERIHLLYAGPGPNAPFFLLLTPYFSPEEIAFTLVEAMPESRAAAARLVEAFELGDYVHAIHQEDAARYVHRGPALHGAVAEIMLCGLRREGQFAVCKNLAPQLAKGGFLVPEEIDLRGALTDPSLELSNVRAYPLSEKGTSLRRDLGSIVKLSLNELRAAHEADPEAYADAQEWPAANIRIPALTNSATTWTIMTRIRLFGHIELSEGESGLTMPLYEVQIPPVQEGDEIRHVFRLGEVPGLYCEHHRPRPRILPAES